MDEQQSVDTFWSQFTVKLASKPAGYELQADETSGYQPPTVNICIPNPANPGDSMSNIQIGIQELTAPGQQHARIFHIMWQQSMSEGKSLLLAIAQNFQAYYEIVKEGWNCVTKAHSEAKLDPLPDIDPKNTGWIQAVASRMEEDVKQFPAFAMQGINVVPVVPCSTCIITSTDKFETILSLNMAGAAHPAGASKSIPKRTECKDGVQLADNPSGGMKPYA